jgi:hypothetical protein
VLVSQRRGERAGAEAEAINALGYAGGATGTTGFQGNPVVAAPSQVQIQLSVTSPNPVDVDAAGRQEGASVETTVSPTGASPGAERFRISLVP